MNPKQHLEHAAIRAHQAGQRWADFWQKHHEDVRRAEPWNLQRYRHLVGRLMHLVVTGNSDGFSTLIPETGEILRCKPLWKKPADCPPPPLPPAWLAKITEPNILQFLAPAQEMDTLTGVLGELFPATSEEYVEQAIRRTLPCSTGTRNDCLKRFLVLLKRHPDFGTAPVESIRSFVWEWHKRAIPKIKDRHFIRSTWKETKALWPKTDPRRQGLDNLAAIAFQHDPPVFVYERKYKPKLVKLVLLCRALQSIWGDPPFRLDCRPARDLIGVRSPMTAKNYFDRLENDRVIRCERKGRYKEQVASEWRYLLPTDAEDT